MPTAEEMTAVKKRAQELREMVSLKGFDPDALGLSVQTIERVLTLKCFCLGGEEWVIAYSIEDALELWQNFHGGTWVEMSEEPLGDNWKVLAMDQKLTVTNDEGYRTERAVSEWIIDGRGHLASANW